MGNEWRWRASFISFLVLLFSFLFSLNLPNSIIPTNIVNCESVAVSFDLSLKNSNSTFVWRFYFCSIVFVSTSHVLVSSVGMEDKSLKKSSKFVLIMKWISDRILCDWHKSKYTSTIRAVWSMSHKYLCVRCSCSFVVCIVSFHFHLFSFFLFVWIIDFVDGVPFFSFFISFRLICSSHPTLSVDFGYTKRECLEYIEHKKCEFNANFRIQIEQKRKRIKKTFYAKLYRVA